MCQLAIIETNYGLEIQIAAPKKKHIENIIQSASSCNHISEIILFGSSLSSHCTDISDIDIAIISDYSLSRLERNKGFSTFLKALYAFDYNQEYDRIYFKSLGEIYAKRNDIAICSELAEKGKIIYRRDNIDVTANFALNC